MACTGVRTRSGVGRGRGMNFVPVPFPGPASGRYLEILKHRRDVLDRLCTAARDYLCLELDEAIERAENPPQPVVAQFANGPEMLVSAVQRPCAKRRRGSTSSVGSFATSSLRSS